MTVDKHFLQDIAQREQERLHLLTLLGSEQIPVTARCVRPEDPAPIMSQDRYFMDKQENQYCLPSDKYHKFNELLDRIVKESPQDNGDKLVKEFLDPFKTT